MVPFHLIATCVWCSCLFSSSYSLLSWCLVDSLLLRLFELRKIMHGHMCCKLCKCHSHILSTTCYSIICFWVVVMFRILVFFPFQETSIIFTLPLGFVNVCLCLFFSFPSLFLECILLASWSLVCVTKRRKPHSRVK